MSDVKQHNKWLEEEIQIIRDNYRDCTDEELQKLIPRHTVSSIACKRKRMKLNVKYKMKKYGFNDFKIWLRARVTLYCQQKMNIKTQEPL